MACSDMCTAAGRLSGACCVEWVQATDVSVLCVGCAVQEYNQLNEKVQKLHHDLEEQIHTNTQLLAENSQKQVGGGQHEEGRIKGLRCR